jgi:hypothetical protein
MWYNSETYLWQNSVLTFYRPIFATSPGYVSQRRLRIQSVVDLISAISTPRGSCSYSMYVCVTFIVCSWIIRTHSSLCPCLMCSTQTSTHSSLCPYLMYSTQTSTHSSLCPYLMCSTQTSTHSSLCLTSVPTSCTAHRLDLMYSTQTSSVTSNIEAVEWISEIHFSI